MRPVLAAIFGTCASAAVFSACAITFPSYPQSDDNGGSPSAASTSSSRSSSTASSGHGGSSSAASSTSTGGASASSTGPSSGHGGSVVSTGTKAAAVSSASSSGYCESAAAATSSSSSGVASGACTDQQDQTSFSSHSSSIGTDLATCAFMSSPASCIETKDGFTSGCGDCLGDLADCGKQNCVSVCPNNSMCSACLAYYCYGAFQSCSGVSGDTIFGPPNCGGPDAG